MSWEAGAAIGGLLSGAAALVGLMLQRAWVRKQVKEAKHAVLFSTNIDGPTSKAIEALDDLEVMVFDFKRNVSITADALCSKGIRTNRAINSAIERAATYDTKCQDSWDAIATERFEEVLNSATEENRNLSARTLSNEMSQIRRSLVAALKAASEHHAAR